MPLIRGQATLRTLTADRRKDLLGLLAKERSGGSDPNGPVIFEIPLEQSDRIDVLVVWDAFEGLRSEDRTGLILEVYKDEQARIAQALGVTYQEAVEQYLLPYAVIPMTRRGEVDPAELRKAMLAEGAIRLPGDKADLRFPTMAMAEAAHQRLCERLPRGYWSIAQTASPID
jgi:hypothetical protein